MSIRYREFPVDDALAPYVRQIWLLECDGPALFGGPERIVADGVVEAIFHYRRPFTMRFARADAMGQPVSLLVSQISRYVEIQPAAAGGFVSVRFHPWGAHHFFAVPMREIGDRATPADEVWPHRDVREVEDRIATAGTDEDRAGAVQAFLRRRLDGHHKQDVSALVRALWRTRAPLRIDRIAGSLGISQRRLERTFAAALGMTPKHLTRLARFLRACRRLRHAPDARLTGVAHDAGFYDQAHFIHEFRAFSGMTPGEFAASPRVSALDVE
ncbi:MAG: helix-turn-helix domain-containing protein [Acidobacteria bacterium]|nr:helix-turn-helix domain-containing protein [Acidobacteriota bacterium]